MAVRRPPGLCEHFCQSRHGAQADFEARRLCTQPQIRSAGHSARPLAMLLKVCWSQLCNHWTAGCGVGVPPDGRAWQWGAGAVQACDDRPPSTARGLPGAPTCCTSTALQARHVQRTLESACVST